MSDILRPKSAPPRNSRRRGSSARTPRDVTDADDNPEKAQGPPQTLEDTVNRFHTTDRILHRMKERRRTEADIIVNEKPAGLLAMELPTRRMSKFEADCVVARVCQPTASSSARTASIRRINAKDIYVPPSPKKAVRIQNYQLDCDRFKGNRPMSGRELHSLVHRLSSYDNERSPADSRRSQTPEVRERLGSLASYRWRGIKNC